MEIKLKKYPTIKIISKQLTNKTREELNYHSKNSIIYPKSSLINYFNFKLRSIYQGTGKLVELIFFGLNYNAKRIKHFRKPWVLDLQKSHKIKVTETRISKIKTKIFKRRVLFFSFDKEKLTNLVNLLKMNRKQNSYSGHGLISRDDHYKTKPGKVRQK